MQLVRDFLRAVLEWLRDMSWCRSSVERFVDIIVTEVMDPVKGDLPDSLRIHLADIYMEEIAAVLSEEVGCLTLTFSVWRLSVIGTAFLDSTVLVF